MTKTVDRDEVGKVFSAMALIAAATRTVINTVIKQVYNATLEVFPSAYLIMAACIYLLAFALNSFLFAVREEIDDCDDSEADKADKDSEDAGATGGAQGMVLT